eukprot:134723_1
MKSPIIMRVFVIFTLCRLLVEAEPSAKFLKEYKKLASFVIDTLTEEQAQDYHDCTKNGFKDIGTMHPSCTRTMFSFYGSPERRRCHSELFKSVYNVESWKDMEVQCTGDHEFRQSNVYYNNLDILARSKFSVDPALNAQFDTLCAEFETRRVKQQDTVGRDEFDTPRAEFEKVSIPISLMLVAAAIALIAICVIMKKHLTR